MLGKDLSRALGDLPLEMVEEASACGNRKSGRKMWMRVAALAATIAIVLTVSFWPSKDGLVTAPGVLKVYAYDETEGTENLVANMFVDAMKYEPVIHSVFLNYSVGIAVTFDIPDGYWGDAEITYEVHANVGEFWKYDEECRLQNIGDSYVTKNDEKRYWQILSPNAEETIKENNGIYIDVIIRADDVPVGYAVIEIGGESHYFFTVRAETVCFPLVDGNYQTVSEEYIQRGIAKLKRRCSEEYTYEEKLAEYKAYIESVYGTENKNEHDGG